MSWLTGASENGYLCDLSKPDESCFPAALDSLTHEMVHAAQYRELGRDTFPLLRSGALVSRRFASPGSCRVHVAMSMAPKPEGES